MSDYLETLWLQWGRSILAQIPHMAQAMVVALVALYLAGRVQRWVERIANDGYRQRELSRLLGRLARIGVLVGGLLIVLSIFNQTQLLASFIASLGIFGLLIAFALQDITRNFAAGVLLLLQRPFGLDDRIRVEPFEGVVTDITLRATVLRTVDGHEVLIPNAQVYSGAITNLTRYPLRRHAVAVTIPATADPGLAQQQIEQALRNVSGVQPEPAPIAAATGIGADNQQFEARFWLKASAPEAPAIVSAVTVALQRVVQDFKRQTAS